MLVPGEVDGEEGGCGDEVEGDGRVKVVDRVGMVNGEDGGKKEGLREMRGEYDVTGKSGVVALGGIPRDKRGHST